MLTPTYLRAHRLVAATAAALILVVPAAMAQSRVTVTPSSAAPSSSAAGTKRAGAVRVADGSLKLDGRLDDAAWQSATPVTDFRQAEPTEGAAPTDTMEVRFAYDSDALWVGARLRNVATPGGRLPAPMSRRDDGDQAEYLQIELDTYHDRRTAYMFGVTASGVRLDHFHPTDNENDVDAEFNPVWEARTTVQADGWTAEMVIPFSQLRFTNATDRVWGLNIKRWRPSLREEDFWVVVGRTARGWASRFGELRGLDGVQPRQRLEILPYVAGSSRVSGNRDVNNPFDDGKNLGGRVGADMKVGLGPNVTLEATVNPDFGQVEADPAEVNLTVFETILAEKRPFFNEGNNVLEAGTSNYYYSRRIGARPIIPATGQYVDYPEAATILGAAKLTGHFRNGASVGFLGAVTDTEVARLSNQGTMTEATVAPRTEWGVARLLKDYRGGNATVGAHLTLVHREMDVAAPLAALLVRNAITTGIDGRVRFFDRTYEAAGNIGLTFVNGEPAAVARVQRASGHYLQRVDQPQIRYDPTRRELSGAQIQGSVAKIAGRHWLFASNIQIESPEFEPSDFGRLNYAGDITGGPRVTYRETRPGRYLRAYSTQLGWNEYWYFDTDLGFRSTLSSNNSATLKNFWVATLNLTEYLRGEDAQLTRGGPAMGTPLGFNAVASLRNATGSRRPWSGSVTFKSNELGDRVWSGTGSLTAQPTPSLRVSVAPIYSLERGTPATFSGPINRQYLTTLSGGRAESYGKRYVFGLVDRSTLSTQLRVNYTFKPDITLDVYMEPFAASGRYEHFGEMDQPHQRQLRLYGEAPGTTLQRQANGQWLVTDGASAFTLQNYDFNIRSFRSNVVLKWEWRRGSTLYMVWQQNRSGQTTDGAHVGAGDLLDAWSAPGDNIFAIKSTLWLSR